MAISQAICNSFKQELLTATHNFSVGGSTFKIALYTNAANLSAATTAYTGTGEVAGTGYAAGGKALTNVAPALSGSTAIVDFDDVTWPNSTITARGALIFNSTATNKAVQVLDFGSDKSSTAGDFTVIFPAPDAANAIIRLT